MDGTADSGAPGARQQNAAPGGLRPLTSALVLFGLALLLGTLSVLVMLPAAQYLRSFQDGERAPATLHTSGSCMLGRCQVKIFEADGRTVVADLPVGSGGGKNSVGTPMIVLYQADDPQVAVREDDAGGGGAAALTVMSGGAALLFLVLSGVALRRATVARRPDARPDSAGRAAA
ncbi:hypothetical protein [Streptomyces sp. NBC_01578]|uniref:hypothetical protein n=1 Tax=Streptomyces sp. NBC_01578 TaxID=2975884 RepID=UPI003863C92B